MFSSTDGGEGPLGGKNILFPNYICDSGRVKYVKAIKGQTVMHFHKVQNQVVDWFG